MELKRKCLDIQMCIFSFFKKEVCDIYLNGMWVIELGWNKRIMAA